jgi:hypothetical protein
MGERTRKREELGRGHSLPVSVSGGVITRNKEIWPRERRGGNTGPC